MPINGSPMVPVPITWTMDMVLSSELLFLGTPHQRERRCGSARDHIGHFVEVAGAHFPLMAGGGVAGFFHCELTLLQFDISSHAFVGITAREFEHRGVEGVETGQRDELELV